LSARKQLSPLELTANPKEAAKQAGLRYVTDSQPGFSRRRAGRSFRYLGIDGKPLRDPDLIRRIRALVIPPAWKNVWICPSASGHLQATGRDARGRKQSRYHPRWREVRDETKYERMSSFGAALPAIREHVDRDIVQPGLPQTKILATIVRLMETTSIRVGNEEYARSNHSYGLTTMRNRHVQIDGSKITFSFEGKSGVKHVVDLQDRRLAKIIQRCQDIPGYELFQYIDESGEHHTIDSADVNEYLRGVSGDDFTAKDFRTWTGTVTACRLLRALEPFESDNQAKKNIVEVIKSVASGLGNTPSVCRKCYVHPVVLDVYLSGSMPAVYRRRISRSLSNTFKGLQREERDLLRLLDHHLKSHSRRSVGRSSTTLK
jgi:DNA topoisomerase I